VKETKLKNKKEIIKCLNEGKRIYLKKPGSWQKIHLYWENTDKWFLNISVDKRSNKTLIQEKSTWITANDIEHFVGVYLRHSYQAYLEIDE